VPDRLGPPGGPKDSWAIYKGVLYHNYFPSVRDRFFQDAEKNIELANKRWIGWWGKKQSGAFNTDCGVFPGGRQCKDTGHYQIIPPIDNNITSSR